MAGKAAEKATKKTTTKKATTKKMTNKVSEPTEQKKTVVAKTRHFSVIYGGKKLSTMPSGKRPKQAANKALTSIFSQFDEAQKKKMIGKDIKFTLYENGKRKKNAKGELVPRRIFFYVGKREETKKMTGGKPANISISHEVITYCNDCKDRIEKLKTIDPDNVLSKKQVNKNIRLFKKYVKAADDKKPELDEHIKKFMKEYEAIVNCTKCKKEQKTISYKFTNIVKKLDTNDFTDEEKKITSEFIDSLEEQDKKVDEKKEEEVKEEVKKEEPKKTKKTVPKKKQQQ